MSNKAKLRCCASCEWIYKDCESSDDDGCPLCNFGSYGARHVFGDDCYKYQYSQKPWKDQKMANESGRLNSIIDEKSAKSPKKVRFILPTRWRDSYR